MSERISGRTKLVSLFARPSHHSLSPLMHNESYRKLGLDYVYMAFDVGVAELEEAVNSMRILGMAGANVSMPNKQAILPYLDALSSEARLIGAVNTVVNQDGKGHLVGYNTDGIGAISALREEGVDIVGKIVTLAGIGGAGRALAVQAAFDGAKEIRIFNNDSPNFEAALPLVAQLNQLTECKVSLINLQEQSLFEQSVLDSTIFINATSVGMASQEGLSLIEKPKLFHSDLVVYDLIYQPYETRLLSLAKKFGAKRTINGLGMVLHQGATAFQLITGKQMPIDCIRKLLF